MVLGTGSTRAMIISYDLTIRNDYLCTYIRRVRAKSFQIFSDVKVGQLGHELIKQLDYHTIEVSALLTLW